MNFLALIPVIIEVVKLVEQLMPESKGKEKLDAAVALVENVTETVTPVLPTLINTTVTLMNLTGGFEKKGE